MEDPPKPRIHTHIHPPRPQLKNTSPLRKSKSEPSRWKNMDQHPRPLHLGLHHPARLHPNNQTLHRKDNRISLSPLPCLRHQHCLHLPLIRKNNLETIPPHHTSRLSPSRKLPLHPLPDTSFRSLHPQNKNKLQRMPPLPQRRKYPARKRNRIHTRRKYLLHMEIHPPSVSTIILQSNHNN